MSGGNGGNGDELQARIADLATGFALDELNDEELGELHRYLSSAESGNAAARTAWRTLQTVTDLRAERGSVFQDTVRAQVESSSASGVTGRFLRRIGLRRPELTPVGDAADTLPSRRPVVIAVVAACVALVATWWWLARPAALARVVGVVGRASVNDTTLGPGDALGGQPVAVADAAVIGLRWPDGNQAQLTGPGTLVPQATGLALLGGVLQAEAAAPLLIGLPDGTLQADAGTRLTVAVVDGRSALGVTAGSARIGGTPLTAGTAWADGMTCPWRSEALTELPSALPHDGARSWHLRFNAAPVGDGRLRFTWDGGSLRFEAASVTLLRADGSVRRTLRTPNAIETEIAVAPGGWSIRILGEDLLHETRPPARLVTASEGRVAIDARYRSGPPLPDEVRE